MRCARCGTESQGAFCPTCGAALAVAQTTGICSRCGTPHSLPQCPFCGFPSAWAQYQPGQQQKRFPDLLSFVWNISIVLVLVLLAMNIFSLLFASVTMIIPRLSVGALGSLPMFVIFPDLMVLFFITDTVVIVAYFVLIVAILLFTYIYLAVTEGREVVHLLKSPLSSALPRLRSRNRWSMVSQLFLATIFFQVSYILLLNYSGVETPVPTGLGASEWQVLFDLANASVYEEIVSRVALIGLPLFLASLVSRWRNVHRWRISGHIETGGGRRYVLGSFRYLIGGNVDRNSPGPVLSASFFFLLLSSFAFGLAHRGWGDWKLVPAFVAGLALGYAFLRGGFLAAVLLHFATDYLSAVSLLGGSDIALQGFLSFFILALLILGSGFFLYYCVYSYNLVVQLLSRVSRPAPVRAEAIPWRMEGYRQPGADLSTKQWQIGMEEIARYLQPGDLSTQSRSDLGGMVAPFGTFCQNCGWPEAVLIEGKLKCTNCGKKR